MRKITYTITVFVLILIACTTKTPPQETTTSTSPQGKLQKIADQAYLDSLEQALQLFRKTPLSSQQIDSLVRTIRSEYNHIVENKKSYKKTVFDIDENDYEEVYAHDDDEAPYDTGFREKIITYYTDEKNNQIKLISLYETFAYHTVDSKTETEYYLRDNKPFFIFCRHKCCNFAEPKVSEYRIYLQENTRIKCLEKSAVRNLVEVEVIEEIEKLLQKTDNTEVDCEQLDINVSSIEDLLNIYYGRNSE